MPAILSIFVCDTIFVSDHIAVSVRVVEIHARSGFFFTASETAALREALRISIGDDVDKFTNESLYELGMSLLEATGIVLKAKYRREDSSYYLRKGK